MKKREYLVGNHAINKFALQKFHQINVSSCLQQKSLLIKIPVLHKQLTKTNLIL